MTATKRA